MHIHTPSASNLFKRYQWVIHVLFSIINGRVSLDPHASKKWTNTERWKVHPRTPACSYACTFAMVRFVRYTSSVKQIARLVFNFGLRYSGIRFVCSAAVRVVDLHRMRNGHNTDSLSIKLDWFVSLDFLSYSFVFSGRVPHFLSISLSLRFCMEPGTVILRSIKTIFRLFHSDSQCLKRHMVFGYQAMHTAR